MSTDKDIFEKIKQLNNFKPSSAVNSIFTDLVKFSINYENIISLSDEELESVRLAAAKAEYEMENFWADEIINSKEKLEDFWYYKNYLDLVDLEIQNVNLFDNKMNKNILFIGSGPFPLSGIILAQKYNYKITCLDIDSSAIKISQKLVKKLNLEENFKFISKSILEVESNIINNFDLIYVAALAGELNSVKGDIINYLSEHISINTLLLCRSSYANRVMLYLRIDKKVLSKLNILLEVRPYNYIVNSFYLLNKR